jgi:hypothetical protein
LLQAAVYAIAATLASGLAAQTALAMLLSQRSIGSHLDLADPRTLAIGCVTFVRIRHPIETWGIFESILHVVVIAVLTWTAAGTADRAF